MRSKIYIVRHGETLLNAQGRFQGQADVALSDTGRKQAEAIARLLSLHKNISHIYSSPMIRAQQTAGIIQRQAQCALTVESTLIELDFGDFQGEDIRQTKEAHSDFFKKRAKAKADTPFPHGESYRELCKRLTPFADSLFQKEGSMVVVGHDCVNRVLRGLWLGIPLEESVFLRQDHHQIFVVSFPERSEESIYIAK